MKTILTLILITFTQISSVFAGEAFRADEMRSAIIAVQKYKDLTRPNTDLYRSFGSIFHRSVKAKSKVFKNPNWPLLMADKAYQSLPALKRGGRTVGRVKIVKYEDAVKDMMNSNNADDRAWAQLEFEAYRAELAGNQAKARELRSKQGDLECLIALKNLVSRLEALLIELR